MKVELLSDGLGYPESPRWHAGELWFSDLHAGIVSAVAPTGAVRTVARIPGDPSGLAFDAAGPLVVSMSKRMVMRLTESGLSEYANLSGHARTHLNDMVMTRSGVAFVGVFGYDLASGEAPRPAPLLRISPDGSVSVAAHDLLFANGMATVSGVNRLLVAETPAHRITSFVLTDHGVLRSRTTFAHLGRRSADGICVDAEGGVWFGSPFTSEFVRLDPQGRQTHVVPTPGRWAISCAFGGPDQATLYLLTADTDMKRFHRRQSAGRIEVMPAPVPGPAVAVA